MHFGVVGESLVFPRRDDGCTIKRLEFVEVLGVASPSSD